MEASDDEKKGFLDGRTKTYGSDWHLTVSRRTLVIVSAVNLMALLVSTGLFSVWFYNQHIRLNGCLRQVSTFSPIHDRLDLGLTTKRVSGTFFTPKHPSVARELPNPTADAVWWDWEVTKVIPVTQADIVRMGKDPTTAVKLEDHIWGLGNDAYATTLDVFHQIHCVNALRRIAYGTYYNSSQGSPDHMTKAELHINHCVDILLQALQCSGNANLITMHWVETQDIPFPDFSIDRQCIDFERLDEWRNANTIDMDKYGEVMLKPEGVKQIPMADDYYIYWGGTNPNHINGTNPGEDFIL